MSGRGDRKHSEMIAEWRQQRRERGLPEPRVVNHRVTQAPDYSADVGAAKPGEYLHRGKWADEDFCAAWVAYYLASLPQGAEGHSRRLRGLGEPAARCAQAQRVPATRRLERGQAQGRGTTEGAGSADGAAHAGIARQSAERQIATAQTTLKGVVAMEGRITIELRTEHTPDSGSGMPDLGHDAYWLMKAIPALTFKDANGKERPISDKYKIVRASTEIR